MSIEGPVGNPSTFPIEHIMLRVKQKAVPYILLHDPSTVTLLPHDVPGLAHELDLGCIA